MSNWPKKPIEMSQAEYDMRTGAAKEAHRIYMSTINHMIEEFAIADPKYQDHAFGIACIMITEYIGRIMGGPKKLMKEVKDAAEFIEAFRKLRK